MANLFNSALVVTPEGNLATCYRKYASTRADRNWANPGWRRPVCPTPMGRVAPAICMDINDPKLALTFSKTHTPISSLLYQLDRRGTASTSLLDATIVWLERLVVAANSWGEDRGVEFCGRSAIVAPDGTIVAQADTEGDEVLLVDVQQNPMEWLSPTPAEA